MLDRNGKVLAVSEDAANVIATPYQVEDPARDRRAAGARLLGEPEAELLEALSDRSRASPTWPARSTSPTPSGSRSSSIRGISTLPDSRRLYPQGELAAQVIGAVGTENEGLTGLEQAEDDMLGGDDGEQEVVHDARGNPIRFDTVRAGERRRGHPA